MIEFFMMIYCSVSIELVGSMLEGRTDIFVEAGCVNCGLMPGGGAQAPATYV